MQARSATEVRPFIVLPFGSPRDISAAKGQNQVNNLRFGVVCASIPEILGSPPAADPA